MYRYRSNYWSCTDFADWLRGTGKPDSASADDWDNWGKKSKVSHPIRHWLAEVGLDRIQDILYFPYDVYREIHSYIDNRYITKTHALTSNLKRGQYHEFEERLLHCMFHELVNFVEIEKAHMQVFTDNTGKWKKKFTLGEWRSAEAGIAYLEWESKLTMDETWGIEPSDKSYGKPPQQALNAIETLKLYRWWKNVRPTRKDPYDESGWNEYCKNAKNFKSTGESRKLLAKLQKLEDAYDEEDCQAMIRLIKLRKYLWT